MHAAVFESVRRLFSNSPNVESRLKTDKSFNLKRRFSLSGFTCCALPTMLNTPCTMNFAPHYSNIVLYSTEHSIWQCQSGSNCCVRTSSLRASYRTNLARRVPANCEQRVVHRKGRLLEATKSD